jgi:hypothetical protein
MLLKPLADRLWGLVQAGIITQDVLDDVLANAGIKLDDLKESD